MQIRNIDTDILILGGGVAGCGAAYEARNWGKDLKIIIVEKAKVDRSGAATMGFSAINTFLGTKYGENSVEDYVRFVREDLMGIVREDLVYDVARHVDSSVELLESWGLPIIKDEKTGKYARNGRWRILIHGESFKPLVAEAADRAATQIWNRVMITHLLFDPKNNRIAGAVGFDERYGSICVFKSKAVILATGGASHIFRPEAVGEGWGRTWNIPWSAGSAYALAIHAGAKMTQMEIRLVVPRFKDSYGPADSWILPRKSVLVNANNRRFQSQGRSLTKSYGIYANANSLPRCLRNHLILEQMRKGRSPIFMRMDKTPNSGYDQKESQESDLGLTTEQAAYWPYQNTAPTVISPEVVLSEPYIMGSHAVNAGAWVSGPADIAPDDYQWGYNRMTTINGLFAAGDAAGGAAHKFSSGSFAEGRIAGKAAVKFVKEIGRKKPQPDRDTIRMISQEIFRPMENYEAGQQFVPGPRGSPYYLDPIQGLKRLEKIMDEYAGGRSSMYTANATGLKKGLDLLELLKNDLKFLGAEDTHQLLRAWELIHRVITAESVIRHTLFRKETRWPGYYYRSDYPKIDDENWKVFVLSEFDPVSGHWSFETAPIRTVVKD